MLKKSMPGPPSTWPFLPIGGSFKPNIATASAEAHRSYEGVRAGSCGSLLKYEKGPVFQWRGKEVSP